ncbi:MAG: CvpA family protein [Candidatus Omnitrophica bacterium]|nr:CvpA family protein [Candidatus Omnitrophota bacterium]
MIMEIIQQTNFLDIVIIILVIRICYIAAKGGLAVEIFKLLGALFATYISMHFYTGLADNIKKGFFPKGMPIEFADFLVFIVLALLVYLCFVAIRSALYRFIKLEAVPEINKFGGIVLGLLRSFLAVGLLVYILSISTIDYLTTSAKHSYLGSRAFMVAPNTYGWLWNSIFSKFSPKENYNSTVTEVIERFNRK